MLDRISGSDSPSQLIKEGFGVYRKNFPSNSSINGRILELLVCEVLVRNGVVPFYFQAKLSLVPDITLDILLYDPDKPVALACKTTVRERYKQAELEGTLLRQVYRRSETHLLTIDDDCHKIQTKIKDADVVGINSCIRADGPDFDGLIIKLKARRFSPTTPTDPLDKGRLIPNS